MSLIFQQKLTMMCVMVRYFQILIPHVHQQTLILHHFQFQNAICPGSGNAIAGACKAMILHVAAPLFQIVITFQFLSRHNSKSIFMQFCLPIKFFESIQIEKIFLERQSNLSINRKRERHFSKEKAIFFERESNIFRKR